MALSKQQTAKLREKMRTIDPDHHLEDRASYEEVRRDYMIEGEGRINKAYDDGKENITVGVGFNMSRMDAKREWQEAFGESVSFEAVYHKKKALSSDEMDLLLDYSLNIRETQLKEIYREIWRDLKPNERLAIESAYYNAPALVKKGTRFYGHLKNYIKQKDKSFLKQAAYELKERSNPEKSHLRAGIQNRRDSEAEMLFS